MAGQDNDKPKNNLETASDNGVDPPDENISEEYDILDSRLDELNSALDYLEQKNDDIHEKLKELLQSNIDIRQQLRKENMDTDEKN